MKHRLHFFTLLSRFVPLLAVAVLLFITSCETPEKVLKSTDLDYKYNKAMYWYNKKDYYKCIPVFEELIGLYKGTKSTEDLYYYYAMANYKQGDYMIAAYHFKNFTDLYPNNSRSEECLYMHAKSNEKQSPKSELDPSYTYKALEAYDLFVNSYPTSNYILECNDAVKALRRKLERKALAAADLYYKTSNYKAAATSYINMLVNYPDIAETEFVHFMIVKSYYKYAGNSVVDKRSERFVEVLRSFKQLENQFSKTKYLTEAQGYARDSKFQTVKSAYEWAQVCPYTDRDKQLNFAIAQAKFYKPQIADTKEQAECDRIIERSYFLMVKSAMQHAESVKLKDRADILQRAVTNYYTFADLFKNSKYAKEAEHLFLKAQDEIKQLKTVSNG